MVRAAVRLHERMAFAFARGSLADYLRKIGMAEELGLGPQHNANLAKVEDAVLILLAQKIRRAIFFSPMTRISSTCSNCCRKKSVRAR